MASDFRTLADVMALADLNLDGVEVTELLQDAPLLGILPAVQSSNGQLHKYVREIGAPTVGFRTVNAGRLHDDSTEEIVTVTLKLLDASWSIDKAIVDEIGIGEANRQTSAHLRAAFKKFETAIIYGTDATSGDAASFSGLFQELTAGAGEVTEHTGTAAGADALTSILLIRADRQNVVAVAQGEIQTGNLVEGRFLEEGTTDKYYNGYSMDIHAWLGLEVGTKYSAHRIANVATATASAASKKTSDDLILNAVAAMPYEPTHIVMNRFALRDLRNSRTATNSTGAPAPFPTEVGGIPIVKTTTLTVAEAEI